MDDVQIKKKKKKVTVTYFGFEMFSPEAEIGHRQDTKALLRVCKTQSIMEEHYSFHYITYHLIFF